MYIFNEPKGHYTVLLCLKILSLHRNSFSRTKETIESALKTTREVTISAIPVTRGCLPGSTLARSRSSSFPFSTFRSSTTLRIRRGYSPTFRSVSIFCGQFLCYWGKMGDNSRRRLSWDKQKCRSQGSPSRGVEIVLLSKSSCCLFNKSLFFFFFPSPKSIVNSSSVDLKKRRRPIPFVKTCLIVISNYVTMV